MGYVRHMSQVGLNPIIGLTDGSAESLDRLIEMWREHFGKLAVISYHDAIAFRFLNALQRHGIAVPDDVALLGNNNNPVCDLTNPKLSSISYPFEEMAKAMLLHALAMADGGENQRSEILPYSFAIRESCGGSRQMGDKLDKQ